MREEGYRDWHILLVVSNLIVQYRIESRYGRGTDFREHLEKIEKENWQEETAVADLPPMDLFSSERMEMQKKVIWVSIAKTWGLGAPRQTPDFDAFKRMLVARYGCGVDDVEHENFFPGI